MKKNFILMLVAVMTLVATSCKDDESEYFLDGEWNVTEMNTLNEQGEILNTVTFGLGQSIITIDQENYKEEVNTMKGDTEVHVVSTGNCVRSGNTYRVEIEQSNIPSLKGQKFSLEFIKLTEEDGVTKADIYSESDKIIRTGKLVRL